MAHLDKPRYERFCLELLREEAKPNGRRGHAYRRAGYKAKLVPAGNAPADKAAARLLRNVAVRERMRELRAMVAKRAADITADTLVSDLERITQLAEEHKQLGAAVQATMGKARITGHIVDRKESGAPGDFERMTEPELREIVAKYAAITANDTDNADSVNGGMNSGRGGSQASDAGAPVKTDSALPDPTHDGTETKQ